MTRRSKLAGLSPVAPAPVEATPAAPAPDEATQKKAPEKKKPATKTATTSTAKKRTTAAARGADVARAEMIELGIYWSHAVRDEARGAYLADFRALGDDAPNGFDHWVAAAAQAHADRTPKARAAKVAALPVEVSEVDGEPAAKTSTKARVSVSVLDAVEVAIRADEEAGVFKSRSPWVVEAIRVATEEARERSGGTLPTPPKGRLPLRRRVSR